MRLRIAVLTIPLLLNACSGDGEAVPGGSTGGMSSGGAAAATGGEPSGTGGSANTGGSLASGGGGTGGMATGGMASGGMGTGGQATGGQATGGQATGGQATGGQAAGGTPPSGGADTGGADTGGANTGGGNTGGADTGGGGPTGGAETGGAATGGGGPGEVAWGREEDPTSFCDVGTLPEAGSFSSGDPKLPDPFKKLDDTRITDKSEWACRREEILQQGIKYIFGEKPIPAEGAVSGSVSDTSISVQVSEGGNSTQFNVTVDMNGATAPAPAIIYYDGGMGSPTPIPNGVAKIRFSAIEAQGGSGAKSGPFYDVYGSNHPAGYLTAQAWQISRILDVLEQDSSVIDPYRVGLTGCSRNGKGAFVGGVLDNRIALTIPVESGIGGTVALRLVEVLDSYSGSEWPYHAISYVRWLSEVALGPFSSGSSAAQDNTDRLPVDMHEMMALIAPRGLLILDNPSGTYNGLDRNAAWVTGSVAKVTFEAFGLGDHISYQGASGSHCDPNFRTPYMAPLNAMIDKFLKGDDSASTGSFETDLGNKPNAEQHYSWTAPTLTGEL